MGVGLHRVALIGYVCFVLTCVGSFSVFLLLLWCVWLVRLSMDCFGLCFVLHCVALMGVDLYCVELRCFVSCLLVVVVLACVVCFFHHGLLCFVLLYVFVLCWFGLCSVLFVSFCDKFACFVLDCCDSFSFVLSRLLWLNCFVG